MGQPARRKRNGESLGDVFIIASLEKTGHAAFHRLGYPPHDANAVALVSTSFADRNWTRAIPTVHTRQYGL